MTPEHLPDLAVALTTKDSMRTIERTLRSLEGLARRVVVVDSGSTDGTIECCRRLGADVLHREWDGPTNQKQFSIEQCRDHRWILLLDSDETIEEELRNSMIEVMKADDPAYDGWWINRRVWFLDGWLHHTFQPEWRLRLFRGGRGRVVGIGPQGRGGHDRVVVEGRSGRLKGFCGHDSWADLDAFCRRNLELAQRAADYYPRGGTPFHIVFSPPAAMFKQYVLKRGFLDGRRGLIAAAAVASGTLLKHLFIARQRLGAGPNGSGANER